MHCNSLPFRLASTKATTKPRAIPNVKAQQTPSNELWKDTKSHSTLISKLKTLMHLPKAHPVSISDELSGGSRGYFGAAGVFGAASEFQDSTGLF